MDISALSSVQGPPAAPAAGPSAPTTPAERKKAAAQFEAILVRQLLGNSISSMLGGSGHTTGMIYGDLMTDVLAQSLTAGQGLGLGRMIEKQLSPRDVPGAKAPSVPLSSP